MYMGQSSFVAAASGAVLGSEVAIARPGAARVEGGDVAGSEGSVGTRKSNARATAIDALAGAYNRRDLRPSIDQARTGTPASSKSPRPPI
jgi:hypothetical protein